MNARRKQTANARGRGGLHLGEVYLEHQRIGNLVKVSAIHVETALEVSIQGPASAPQNELEKIAINKLKYVLSKKSG